MPSKYLFVLLASLTAVGCSIESSPGDGSSESSKVVAAPKCDQLPTPTCAAGTKLVDSNGDGCALECQYDSTETRSLTQPKQAEGGTAFAAIRIRC